MLNPLNAPPQGVKMLKSPPLKINEAEIDQVVQAVMREDAFKPKTKPRKTLPEIAPAVPMREQIEDGAKRKPLYQPRFRHSAATLALALTISWPWLLPTLLGLAIVLPVIACLTLGCDRISRIVVVGFARLYRLSPVKAEALRSWSMRCVAGLERLLARLPDRWTAGLYLPDFGPTPNSSDWMQKDPFERIRLEQAEI
ncbi:hypothetical protein OEZ49_02845 [Ruegeria sp. WL0004]|uniref:Conjugal transfer protein TraX n=1 Tax=Ruegeria marisflavi TaxID=2984152 RepID=A0ABT2WN94_9RHOB|nr:hypothetical protein [Ruegeria sp. WL0004]MCU9836697.1 hypothetical protein [Ruegeria sp. WL0004]